MAGVITLKFSVIKNGMAELGMKSPIFVPGPVQPQFGPGRMLFFEGFSVDEKGKQHYLDATIAYRQACLRTIEYLRRYGYDDYQIYLLLRYACQAVFWALLTLSCSCAPIEGHIAGIVDVSIQRLYVYVEFVCADTAFREIPNACMTLGMPVDIFDFDIMPGAAVKKLDMGSCAK